MIAVLIIIRIIVRIIVRVVIRVIVLLTAVIRLSLGLLVCDVIERSVVAYRKDEDALDGQQQRGKGKQPSVAGGVFAEEGKEYDDG